MCPAFWLCQTKLLETGRATLQCLWIKSIPHLATLKPPPHLFLWPLLSAQGATQAGCGPAGSPFLFTHQFQAEPCRGSCRVASIVERIDLGCARSVMRVLISLTAPH